MKNSLVSIIILNYNGGKFLHDCIDSVLDTDYDNFEIILVDNDSKDQSHIECKKKFPEITLIENKKNFGYCEGNNIGIRNAHGDFIVLLNPDTIVEKSWLNEILKAYNLIGEGLFQPMLLSLEDKNRINTCGNMIQLFGFGYSRGKGNRNIEQYKAVEKIPYASGACLFLSKNTLDKIGMFDSYLFAYHDDLDLGWRALCQGIYSYFVPSSIVYHAESFSFKWSPFKLFLLERNRWYCLLTHYSKSTFYRILPAILIVELFVLFFYLVKGNIGVKISGYRDIIKNRKQIHEKYMELESKKTVSDSKIVKKFSNEVEVPHEMSGPISAKAFNIILYALSKISRLLL